MGVIPSLRGGKRKAGWDTHHYISSHSWLIVSREHPSQQDSQIVYSKRDLRPSGSQVCPHHIIRTDIVDATSCLGKQLFVPMKSQIDSSISISLFLSFSKRKKNLQHTKMSGLDCNGQLQYLFTGLVFCKACFDLFSWCSPGNKGGEHKISSQLQSNMGMTEKVLACVTVNVSAAIADWRNST